MMRGEATHRNLTSHSSTWERILTFTTVPLVKNFTQKVEKAWPRVGLSLSMETQGWGN